jgi:hypothetical protein
MPKPEWVDVEIEGETAELVLWPSGTEYDAEPANIAKFNIWSCIAALEKHAKSAGAIEPGGPGNIDLTIKLASELHPWEKNVFAVFVHTDDSDQYVAEFTLNTAIGSQEQAVKDTLLPIVASSRFTLARLLPYKDVEHPILEEDGWHQWTCCLSSFPKDATVRDLLTLRSRLSQAAFIPHDSITTPYHALRMVQLGQSQALLGCQESEWLEAKSPAYELTNVHESLWKHELAKDVVQFANTEGGGLLLLGFCTKRKAGIDTIAKITPLPVSETRVQSNRGVMRHRIHPPISGLQVEVFPWEGGHIISIFVPPQRDENRPYLVSGSVIRGRFIHSGITIVRREGDASIPITVQEIHSALVTGRAFLRRAR